MRKIISFLLAALTASCALLFPSCVKRAYGPGSDEKGVASVVTIAGRDLAAYSVLIPSDADECTKTSAQTLISYIEKACGVTLDVVTERVDGAVIEYTKDADGSLGDEGYNIKVTDDGDLLITCGAKRGALYATYYILEKFIGYRFLTDGVEYLYETDGIEIPADFNETEIPTFSYRALNQVGTDNSNFAALHLNAVDANGSGSKDPVTGGNAASFEYGGGVGNLYLHGHSYAYQEAVGIKLEEAGITDLDSEEAMEIFRTYGYNTPERDALGLDSTQPCLTSEDTFNHVMAFNYLLYKERCIDGIFEPGVHFTMIACSPNDNTDFCTCDNCKAVYEEEGSIAGAVFRLSNRVAEAMKEEMPGVGVFTIAYWDARNPPKYTKPDENVCVAFCIGGCNNHTYDHVEECEAAGGNPRLKQTYWDGHRESSSNVSDIAFLEKWAELTNNLYVWYYATTFNYLISPAPNVYNIYNDYKYIASLGVSGVYTEGSSDGYTFETLRGYLAARMMWDPYMSEEEFENYLDEFLMIYYGAGWENVKAYLVIQNTAGDLQGCWTNNFDWPWDMYNKEYYAEHFYDIISHFETAYEKAETEEQKARVRLASIHAYFLGLSSTYEKLWENGSETEKAQYKELYEFLWNYINDEGYLEGEREDGYKCTSFLTGHGGLDNFPESPDDVIDTMRWIFDDFTGQR